MQLAGDRHQEFPARTHQDRRVIVTGVDEGTEQERDQMQSLHETTRGIASAMTKGARVAIGFCISMMGWGVKWMRGE